MRHNIISCMLFVAALAACQTSVQADYRHTTTGNLTPIPASAPHWAPAAPGNCCNPMPAPCCQPRCCKQSSTLERSWDKLCDMERRKNRWLLKMVKKCVGHDDCQRCCPQPCCSPACSPQPMYYPAGVVAPQFQPYAPARSCGCGN